MAFSSKGSFTNEEIKHRVRRVYAKFVSDVDPERLSDHLVQGGVIALDEKQRIRNTNHTPPDRCRALLDHIFTIQHPGAFLVVREALRERDHYLLALIDNQEPECGIHTGTDPQEEGDSKKKKRSKQSLLVEKTNENDLLRKEIEIERTENESLRLANEQLRINAAEEIQVNKTLKEELRNAEAKFDTHIVRLKQELDNNKNANNGLQTNNDKLKQELKAEKTTNNSLQTNICRLVEELNMYKATVASLETNAEKLRKELETTKTDYNEKILIIEQKHDQQQKAWMEENENLRKQIQEQSRSTDKLRYILDPVFVQTIRTKAAEIGKKPIRGLTILDKELFVVTDKSSEVKVYE